MKKKEPISKSSLIISIILLIFGLVLCFNDSTSLFKIVGYIVSGALLLVGIIKLIVTINQGKKYNGIDFGDLMFSILFIALGAIIAILPQSIMVTFSLCIGSIVIINGVQRLILGILVRKVDSKGSLFYLIESILIILVGVVIITQKWTNLIGLFIVIYAISELAGYIFYNVNDKDYSEVLNKKITKEMKESEAKDAEYEEDTK